MEGLVADFKEGAREELDYKKKLIFFVISLSKNNCKLRKQLEQNNKK